MAEALRIAVASEGRGHRIALRGVERPERGGGNPHDLALLRNQLTGIELPRGVEGAFHPLQCAIGFLANPFAQIGAALALTMLAPEDAAISARQVEQPVRYGNELRAIRRIVDVQRRANVQTADINMTIDAEAKPVPGQQRKKPVDEGREAFGRPRARSSAGTRP
jgi:hypothetical protein